MSRFYVKIGVLEAEVLTMKVVTGAGDLFLTRTLPGHWAIQRAGEPSAPYTPTWDGRRFGQGVKSVPEAGLEAQLRAAYESMHREKCGDASRDN